MYVGETEVQQVALVEDQRHLLNLSRIWTRHSDPVAEHYNQVKNIFTDKLIELTFKSISSSFFAELYQSKVPNLVGF